MSINTLTSQQLDHLMSFHNDHIKSSRSVPPAAFLELFDLLHHHAAVTHHTYQPGTVIFAEGDPGSNMFLIRDGRVAVVKGEWHDPIVLAYRSEGELIGEMALLESRPRSASVIALDTVEALCVECTDLREMFAEHPDIAIGIMSTLSARLRSADMNLDTVARVEGQLVEELEVAAQIQARLIPRKIPAIPGWDIAAQLIPARKTSGDFYDFIPLGPGKLGILVADVVDKGAGAALYMAISRTLIRTFATQYPTTPEEMLRATNERIQADVGSDQFVTVFYGVLDSETKSLIYASAGHNPAYLVNKQGEIRPLGKTGIPIGMFSGISWRQQVVQFQPEDMLILYTDGVSEARDIHRAEFGVARLAEVARASKGCSAQDALSDMIHAIRDFIGQAAQFDDITLMVAVCQPEAEPTQAGSAS